MWDVILLGLCIIGAVYGIWENINIHKEGHWNE